MSLLRPGLAMSLMSLVLAADTRAQEGKHGQQRGRQLFYRMVGAQNNAPILPKTESAWTQDGRESTGNTGMADEGFTEYPFCYGLMDFTFVEHGPIYPRLISGAQADESRVNTADMVIDHVYQPDGCVWGLTGREFVQTFTATRDELVSITLMMASEPGIFRAALIDGGPGGRQIGPAKTFTSGHSMEYGIARWIAGQAPLTPGRPYGIRMWREDGQGFSPYLHSIGNAYDGGHLYVDGSPRPESDLAIWIVEQPPDLQRALIADCDGEGWVYHTRGVTFHPRTPNVRMITATVSPVKAHCVDLVVRVFSQDGRLVAGPKRGVACGPDNGPRTAPILFASDEFLVTPGQPYRVEVFTVEHNAELPPADRVEIVPRDMHILVYGEPQPGALPAIYNLTARPFDDTKLQLDWSVAPPAPVRVEIFGPGMKGGQRITFDPGQTQAVIPVWPGHEYDFQLFAVGAGDLVWRTPMYHIQMPRGDEIKAIMHAEAPYPEQFVPLAPSRIASGAEPGPIRYRRAVELVNPDFEDGLTGWTATLEGAVEAFDVGWTSQSVTRKQGIGTKWGDHIAGFTHLAGEQREQVFAKSTLTQRIATTPGHVYLLAGMARTAVKKGPRGDARVRLFADPTGGDDYEGIHSSQWYWTDNEWRRFTHTWTAAAGHATIGFGFFRWRDLDMAGAYVDHVHVYDLGPAPADPRDPVARARDVPSLVLADSRLDADDKVEAFVQAPPGYVVTGLGSRAHYDNITTMWMRVQPLLADGTLGEPEELRHGWEPDSNLEACVELPAGYVATGFGAGIAPEWDVKRFGVWARPLNPDGTLGEEQLFRGGIDRESGFERETRTGDGRVLTGAGLNCMLNDVNGIKATSAALVRTATAEARAQVK